MTMGNAIRFQSIDSDKYINIVKSRNWQWTFSPTECESMIFHNLNRAPS